MNWAPVGDMLLVSTLIIVFITLYGHLLLQGNSNITDYCNVLIAYDPIWRKETWKRTIRYRAIFRFIKLSKYFQVLNYSFLWHL